MRKILFLSVLTCMLLLVASTNAELLAQCPMCKMSAESNMRNGGTAGAGLNAGILYMLIAPYLIVGGIAFWWWRNRRQLQGADMPAELLHTEEHGQMN